MIDINRFRKDRNIKQKDICELLCIAQPYLSAIERGERPLSKEKLSLLHKHYGDIIFNYKNADIVIEHQRAQKNQISDSEERSRFLSIIENLQKTIEHQQRILEGLQKMLHSQRLGDDTNEEALQQYSNQLEVGLAPTRRTKFSPPDTSENIEDASSV